MQKSSKSYIMPSMEFDIILLFIMDAAFKVWCYSNRKSPKKFNVVRKMNVPQNIHQ